jgi:hypothetical protein
MLIIWKEVSWSIWQTQQKAEGKIKEIDPTVFHKKNGLHRYKYHVLGRDRSYFVGKKSPLLFYQKGL